jgi:predicted amidohydrolase
MRLRVAAVQAKSFYGEEEYKNVELAIGYVDQAAKEDAQIAVLPEGYPGPNNGPLGSGGRLTQKLPSPEGEILSRYAPAQPDHMYLNAYLMGGSLHILPVCIAYRKVLL